MATFASLSANTGSPEPLRHHVGERQILHWLIDGDDRDPATLIEQTRNPEAHGCDFGAGCLPHFLDSINRDVE